MISCKNIKRIYIAVVVLMIIVFYYLFIIRVLPLLAYLLIIDFSGWCVYSIYFFALRKRESSLMSLMNDCRIAEFIEKYSNEHAKDTRKGFYSGSAIILATAYMYLGELETSIEMFTAIELQNSQGLYSKAVLCQKAFITIQGEERPRFL